MRWLLSSLLCLTTSVVLADGHASTRGDVNAGEVQFNRQCGACHVVMNPSGEILSGRSTRPGPNLYGVAGQQLATVPGIRYGDSIAAAGVMGLIWTEEAFVSYVQDPTGWLRTVLNDGRARSKMAYRVRQEQQAFDLFAYLSSVAE